MRYPRTIFYFGTVASLAFCSLSVAEEQTFQERLLQPRMDREFQFAAREFQDSPAFSVRTFSGEKRYSTGEAQSKTFEVPTFLGIRLPWFAKKEAPTGTFSRAETTFATDSFTGVEDVRDATRTFSGQDRTAIPVARAVPVREARMEGSAQGSVTEFQQNLGRNLSTEEVRDLLNKPR